MSDLNKLKELAKSVIEDRESFLNFALLLDPKATILLIDRLEAAEAELASRDAAAGEPVGVVMSNSWIDEDSRGEHFWVEWASNRFPEKGTKLFTAAQPSALPPELSYTEACQVMFESSIFGDARSFHIGANWMREQVKASGCKVINRPNFRAHQQFDGLGMHGSILLEHRDALWTAAIVEAGFTVEGE